MLCVPAVRKEEHLDIGVPGPAVLAHREVFGPQDRDHQLVAQFIVPQLHLQGDRRPPQYLHPNPNLTLTLTLILTLTSSLTLTLTLTLTLPLPLPNPNPAYGTTASPAGGQGASCTCIVCVHV